MGKPLAIIQSINFPDYKFGGITKINVKARNEWNREIKDAYVNITFFDSNGTKVDDLRTSSGTMPPLSTIDYTGYWDTSGHNLGSYTVLAVLHYNGLTAEKKYNITLTGRDLIRNDASANASSLGRLNLYAAGMVILVLLNGTLIFLLLRRDKNKKKRRKKGG